ncbi:MAG: 30S ribosomal protein S2 [Thiohalorhabdus sp.]|uniref:30S ribosomal protein S2 n=1 Tax=Thiohalorhabdus sp. TaxID=3094134 RepID=UPI00397ECF4D
MAAENVSMREMLEAGVHFGHRTSRWHPKMGPYIFGARKKIHIINLEKTVPLFREAMAFLRDLSRNGGKVLFVGTKSQARDVIAEQAQRCGMYYVNHRWPGGMLTNWHTIRNSIRRLKDIERMAEDGTFEMLPKKEALLLERERSKLERSLGGIKDMSGVPDAMFVVDMERESIAVAEAKKLGIPVVAVADTNVNPSRADYIIPGNDDAVRAIKLYVTTAADAILEGRQEREVEMTSAVSGDEEMVEVTDDDAGASS